jgi:hypothetical protein
MEYGITINQVGYGRVKSMVIFHSTIILSNLTKPKHYFNSILTKIKNYTYNK